MDLERPDSNGDSGKRKVARPLGREHMPVDYQISLDSYLGRAGFGGGVHAFEMHVRAVQGVGLPQVVGVSFGKGEAHFSVRFPQ